MRLTIEAVPVPMRDGTPLVAEVLRPAGGGPAPVLLTRTPYGQPHARHADDVVALAQAGWAVVIQDVRGRGASPGRFTPFHQEVADGFDTVQWCAGQPWSDGRVAMFGASYRTAAQWLAARGRPSGLRALSPTVGSARFAEGWTYEGGIPTFGFLRGWALNLAATGESEAARAGAIALREQAPGAGEVAELESLLPASRGWFGAPDPASWAPVDVPAAGPVAVAGFHVAGWYDLFCNGALEAFGWAARSGRPQRLIVGPWTHTDVGGRVVGDLDLGPSAESGAVGLPGERFRWLRAALEPDAASLGVSAAVYELGSGRWLELPGWPPAEGAVRSLFPHADATLGPDAGGPWSRTIRHDPAAPVPSLGGRLPGPWPRSGPVEQRAAERHPGLLSFTSAALGAPLAVAGVVRVRLTLSSSSALTDLVVRVCDVHPDGSSYPVLEHGHRLSTTVGRAEQLELELGSIAWWVRPGHRIRLVLAGSSWPRLALGLPATLTVGSPPNRPACLELPLRGG